MVAPKAYGVGFDVALQAIRPDALDAVRLAALTRRASPTAGVPYDVMPASSEQYFRVWRLAGTPSCPVPPGVGVLLITNGAGWLEVSGPMISVRNGMAVLVPHAARCSLHGEVEA